MLPKRKLQAHKVLVVIMILSGFAILEKWDEEKSTVLVIVYAIIRTALLGIMERIRLISSPSLFSFVLWINIFLIILELIFAWYMVDIEVFYKYLNFFTTDFNELQLLIFSIAMNFIGYWILLNYDTLAYMIVSNTSGVIILVVHHIICVLFEIENSIGAYFGRKWYVSFGMMVTAMLAYVAIGDRDLIGECLSKKNKTESRDNADNSTEMDNY